MCVSVINTPRKTDLVLFQGCLVLNLIVVGDISLSGLKCFLASKNKFDIEIWLVTMSLCSWFPVGTTSQTNILLCAVTVMCIYMWHVLFEWKYQVIIHLPT